MDPAGHHGGEEASFHGHVGVAHGVNTPVKGVEVAEVRPDVDLSAGQAAGEELPDRHDSVLARGERRDARIRRSGRFGTCGVLN